MPLEAIAGLIKKRIGIISDSIGMSSIERAVKSRMTERGDDDVAVYLDRVMTSVEELQQLINEVTITETWFFRDLVPFTLLTEYVSQVWLQDKPGAPLKVLSIPCSTGEEPYSIAITLLEAGLTVDEFKIEAIDINTRVLEMARRGRYGKNSFRGKTNPDQSPFLEHAGNEYVVSEFVKSAITFRHGNILDKEFRSEIGAYDIVFSRNLLIYFDVDTKNTAIRNLHRLLADDGLLFLGHAETGRIAQGLFSPVRHPGAFAYQKSTDGVTSSFASSKQKPAKSQASNEYEDAKPSMTPIALDITSSEISKTLPVEEEGGDALIRIKKLADGGKLDEAHDECLKFIRNHKNNQNGYYLMGFIALAMDDDRGAEEWLRKTIYLDPGNYEALLQLAILADERGNSGAAKNYRARAERVKAS
jgi:chemotaxis protein methyltransferase WspC